MILRGGVVAPIAAADPPPAAMPAPTAGQPALVVGTLIGSDRIFAAGFE